MEYENNTVTEVKEEESLVELVKEKLIALGKDKLLPMVVSFAKDQLLPTVLESLKDIAVNDIVPYVADKLSGIFSKKED